MKKQENAITSVIYVEPFISKPNKRQVVFACFDIFLSPLFEEEYICITDTDVTNPCEMMSCIKKREL